MKIESGADRWSPGVAREGDERPRRRRTNHFGPHSKRGAEAAAIFYSLFESAKLAGVDAHRYVLEATLRAIASPGAVTLPEDLT